MGIREVLSVEAVKAALLALTTDGQAIGNSGGTLTGIDAGGGGTTYRTVSRIDPANGNWEGAFLGSVAVTKSGTTVGVGGVTATPSGTSYKGAHVYASSTGTPGVAYHSGLLSPAARAVIIIDFLPAQVTGGYDFPETMIKYGAHADANVTGTRTAAKPSVPGYWILQEGSSAPLRAICYDTVAHEDVNFTATGGGTLSLAADTKYRLIIDDSDPAGPGSPVIFTIYSESGAVLGTATCSTNTPTAVNSGYLDLVGATNDSGAAVYNLWYTSSCIRVRA